MSRKSYYKIGVRRARVSARIDENILEKAKTEAKRLGMTLSHYIESSLVIFEAWRSLDSKKAYLVDAEVIDSRPSTDNFNKFIPVSGVVV